MHESAFDLEARRILRRLSKGGHLKRCAECFLLSGRRGRRIALPFAFVESLRTRGWLSDGPDGFGISPAGERWLKQPDEDPYANQHRVLEARLIKDERGRERYVVVNAAESPLALLRRLQVIASEQYEAGEKLRRDYTLAHLSPRMAVDYEASVGHGSYRQTITETSLAARQRFNRAMRAMGPGLSDVLFDLCCDLKGLEECERARNWPRASAKVVLRIALDRLAEHYGMTAKKRSGRIRSWSMEEEP